MHSVVYSPGDSRGWGIGNSSMRDYYLIGGALQPSDIYTVRVREHWRRKRRPTAQTGNSAVTPRRRRRRTIAIQVPAPTRVLRNRIVTPVVPAVPVPAPTVSAVPVPAAPVAVAAKRRRVG
ncbi:pVII [Turkey adenovirus 3]|uniref:Core protein 1 n=1 Tax=Turkey adenovirus 3 TaxID=41678 RepID=Q68991_9ADEN|nr:core protein I [Turkey adenovirus 3]AP_000483.1 pVII [Turkey siadenovirus A]AAA99143.1 core protein 1 [Turkey adenovirus 3]AAC64529.1 core protein I [Turkey adenovirus 3]QNN94718.1 pVII [Turkey adenovirus 3]QNN94741.1 pVII [Turkey adenovirus 3]QNN94774.1 pVII [Turkey adenovirus 3]